MKWCEIEPYTRVGKSGPESAPRCLTWFNPVISTMSTPTNPPRDNPNGVSKSKESEPTPKEDENTHHNTHNPSSVKTGGSPMVERDRTAPHKNHNSKSPAKPIPYLRVDPETSLMQTTP